MRKSWGFIALVLSFALIAGPLNAATTKAGAKCTKAGAISIVGGKKFTCIKSGKKLVWNKGVAVRAAAKPALNPVLKPVEPTPTPVATPTPVVTPTPVATPTISKVELEKVNIKNTIIYKLVNGSLERKSDLGGYYATDSRDKSYFDPIRAAAYQQIAEITRTPNHPQVSFNWDLRPEFPKEIQEYNLKRASEAAELFNSIFSTKINVKGMLATEKDANYAPIKNQYFSDTEFQILRLVELVKSSNRLYITGGGGYWINNGKVETRFFLGTPSNATTESYKSNWMQVSSHEFFHIVQGYLYAGKINDGSPDFNIRVPHHFREGAASFFGYALSSQNLGWYSDALDNALAGYWQGVGNWKPTKTEDDMVNLLLATESRDDPKAFEIGYPLGSIFYEWVIGTYGYSKFFELASSLSSNASFDISASKVLGINKMELYRKSAPYLLSVFNRVVNS